MNTTVNTSPCTYFEQIMADSSKQGVLGFLIRSDEVGKERPPKAAVGGCNARCREQRIRKHDHEVVVLARHARIIGTVGGGKEHHIDSVVWLNDRRLPFILKNHFEILRFLRFLY